MNNGMIMMIVGLGLLWAMTRNPGSNPGWIRDRQGVSTYIGVDDPDIYWE